MDPKRLFSLDYDTPQRQDLPDWAKTVIGIVALLIPFSVVILAVVGIVMLVRILYRISQSV